jgi:hypothetical protein
MARDEEVLIGGTPLTRQSARSTLNTVRMHWYVAIQNVSICFHNKIDGPILAC